MFQLYDTDGNCRQDPDSSSITTTCNSDLRTKLNIRDVGSSLAYILPIRIREFENRFSSTTHIGVVAQEMKLVHPELVSAEGTTTDALLSVTEVNSWTLIKALQELWNWITSHESRITKLENENILLKARILLLESKI